jgi:cation:H+ antiporter
MAFLQLSGWLFVLSAALYVLVRGSDLFVEGAKRVGLSSGISSFAVGVVIVAFGTSLPELASSIAAAIEGAPQMVVANVVGSNIANILLIIGALALLRGVLPIDSDLKRNELPVFFLSTAIFVAVVYNGRIDRWEGLLLLSAFCVYLWFLFAHAKKNGKLKKRRTLRKITKEDIGLLVLGLTGLLVGAHFVVETTVAVASAFSVPLGIISILAIAVGTSLPELFVVFDAYRKGEMEMAIGSIYGSNTFNMLVVAGVPAVITLLRTDAAVAQLGIPMLVIASAFFCVNGLSERVTRWEGAVMVLLFVYFIFKLTTFL